MTQILIVDGTKFSSSILLVIWFYHINKNRCELVQLGVDGINSCSSLLESLSTSAFLNAIKKFINVNILKKKKTMCKKIVKNSMVVVLIRKIGKPTKKNLF